MSKNRFKLIVSAPKNETAYLNHDGELVLTYDIARESDGFTFRDEKEMANYQATMIVSDYFNFVFKPHNGPLLSQLINAARNNFDEEVLNKSWFMVSRPSESKGFVQASIQQDGESKFNDPVLNFCENTNWLESYYFG